MANPNQVALLLRSVREWNAWRNAHPDVFVDLSYAHLYGADLSGADLSGADLGRAHLYGANLREANLGSADLTGATFRGVHLDTVPISVPGEDLMGANLSRANLSRANLSRAVLTGADLSGANLYGADLTGADLREADLTGAKRDAPPSKSTTPKPQPSQSSTIDWLSLVETYGNTLLITAATLASIIQGLDVIERRWREHKAKHQQQSTSPTSPSSAKTPVSDKDITDILLVMDDGSHHNFQRWVSDPDALRAYIDAFSDPTSKVKPLQVIFRKRKGRALSVDVTKGGKDNRQLNMILSYLDADPQP